MNCETIDMVNNKKMQKSGRSFEEFKAGLKRRKEFLESRGIDLNALPSQKKKRNVELPDVKIDVEEEVTD